MFYNNGPNVFNFFIRNYEYLYKATEFLRLGWKSLLGKT
jgi:hypothetical protein